MASDYAGLIALAQTSLALNMAYIALDRFRYRKKILERFTIEESRAADMPDGYRHDLAWQNVKTIAAGDSPKGWTVGRFGYWFYYLLFQKGVDIFAVYALAISSVLILLIRAYAGLQIGGNSRLNEGTATYDWAAFAIVTVGIVAPVMFVLAGRYAVRCAERSIEDNMAHLAKRMLDEAQEDVDAKLERLME
jgi:hypothetical protein